MTPISRSEAKAAGLLRYFTGEACPQGHVAERSVSNYTCVVCHRLKIRVQQSRGGSQYNTHIRGIKRRSAPGGSQRHTKIKTCKKWRLSGSEASKNDRVARLIRISLNRAIGRGQKAGSTIDLLACSISEFKDYIAAQFQPGMVWDNHGEWHLDHKRPLASFDRSDPNWTRVAFHHTNYQPLWATDNLAKGAQWMEAA